MWSRSREENRQGACRGYHVRAPFLAASGAGDKYQRATSAPPAAGVEEKINVNHPLLANQALFLMAQENGLATH